MNIRRSIAVCGVVALLACPARAETLPECTAGTSATIRASIDELIRDEGGESVIVGEIFAGACSVSYIDVTTVALPDNCVAGSIIEASGLVRSSGEEDFLGNVTAVTCSK